MDLKKRKQFKEMKCVSAGGTHIGELIAGFSTDYP
jgi:hypothetical protein